MVWPKGSPHHSLNLHLAAKVLDSTAVPPCAIWKSASMTCSHVRRVSSTTCTGVSTAYCPAGFTEFTQPLMVGGTMTNCFLKRPFSRTMPTMSTPKQTMEDEKLYWLPIGTFGTHSRYFPSNLQHPAGIIRHGRMNQQTITCIGPSRWPIKLLFHPIPSL